MKRFKNIFVKRECPHCKIVLPLILKINKKLPINKPFVRKNITNSQNFDVVFHQIIKDMKYEGEDEFGVPTISVGKMKGGQLKEDINIKGSYSPILIESFLNGYFNDEMDENFKDVFEEEIKEESYDE